MSTYEFVFKWIKNATKAERHIEEMESFAKKHPVIFMKFHRLSGDIIKNEESSLIYQETKQRLEQLFKEHQEQFEPVFAAIKKQFPQE